MNNFIRFALLCLGIPALCAGVQAHETWLRPVALNTHGTDVALALSSGMAFPVDDHAIEPGRVTSARWRQGASSGDLVVGARGEHALELRASLPVAGSATLALVLPSKRLDLEPDSVEEYLTELGNPPGARERWQRDGRWRENYRKSVKAIVHTAGDAVTEDDINAPMALPMELVPVNASGKPHVGDTLELRLLAKGKPVPDVRVLIFESGNPSRHAQTDSKGGVRFELQRSGPILLHAVWLRAADTRDHDWDSDFASLTLEVADVISR